MSSHSVRRPSRGDPGRIVIGVVLLAVGIGLLLERYTSLAVGDVLGVVWPLALLLPGLVGVVTTRGTGVGPWILTFFGGGFLLANLDVISDGWLGTAWPALLIIIGAGILLRRSGVSAFGGAYAEVADPRFESIAVFSANRARLTSRGLDAGSATAAFGGVELDLREALPTPAGARIHAFAMFGGVTLVVPETWEVQLRGLPIFGGLEDKRPSPAQGLADPPVLHVDGTAIFGGVTVTNQPD